jgi:hypothetical protein
MTHIFCRIILLILLNKIFLGGVRGNVRNVENVKNVVNSVVEGNVRGAI